MITPVSGWTVVAVVGLWCLLSVPLAVLVGRALARRHADPEPGAEPGAAARRADPPADESATRAS